jgi:glycosyltransferase involved in cell wall biosynthesis
VTAAIEPTATPRRVLVIAPEAVGAAMGGAAIRAAEIAAALAAQGPVTLAAPPGGEWSHAGVERLDWTLADPRPLRGAIATAGAVVCQPQWPGVQRWLERSRARVVYDLYDPEPFEALELLRGRTPALRRLVCALSVDRTAAAVLTGDGFVCASERQRDLWIGAMLGARVISPAVYDRDPAFASVIATVPFGVPADPPAARRDGIRARFPAIAPDDEVVLWNGGLWRWLDATAAVRAAAALASRRPRARLVFMGAAGHPDAIAQARAAAAETGLLDRVVFFNDAEWVPYAERADWLLAADCALSAHGDHLETRFAFRTRIVDCLWAGLPVVCTAGDDLAELVERRDLGAAVTGNDPLALAAALERVLGRGRDAYRDGLAAAAAELSWPRVTEPLVRALTAPARGRPLGAGVRRRPGHALRDAGFRAAIASAAAVGIRRWPSL